MIHTEKRLWQQMQQNNAYHKCVENISQKTDQIQEKLRGDSNGKRSTTSAFARTLKRVETGTARNSKDIV